MTVSKRKTIPKGVRFAIFARDGFACRYCGRQSDAVVLVIDHLIPVSKGGTNDDDNLITACVDCNAGKSATLLEQAAPTEADRLRMAQERNEQINAAQQARAALESRRAFRQVVTDLWCDIRRQDEADARTITVIARYAELYGIGIVAGWIEQAEAKLPYKDDYILGTYISGIRRNMLAEGRLNAT